MPAALVNEAWVERHCKAQDKERGWPWKCPNPGNPPLGVITPSFGPPMVSFGDSYSAGEGAPWDAYAVGCLGGRLTHDLLGNPDQCVYNHGVPREPAWLPVSGYYEGTDTEENACHRSARAYPVQLAQALNYSLDFRACSGAISNDYLVSRDAPPNGSAELAAAWNHEEDGTSLRPQGERPIPDDTRLVTIGFGGNNAHFSDVITVCIASEASIQELREAGTTVVATLGGGAAGAELRTQRLDEYVESKLAKGLGPWDDSTCKPFVDAVAADLPLHLGVEPKATRTTAEHSIERTYKEIKQASPETARVIAIGYPRMFPTVPFGSCQMGTGEASMGADEQLAINAFVAQLNDHLRDAASRQGIDFVDIEDAYVPPSVSEPGDTRNRGLCRDAPEDDEGKTENDVRWINRWRLNDDHANVKVMNGSFHPNAEGHRAAKDAILACYRDERACANHLDRRINLMLERGDWKTLSYPHAGCIPREEWDGPVDEWDAQQVSVAARDLTGDGQPEAVVQLSCPASTSAWPDIVQVWDVLSRTPRHMLTIDDLYFRGAKWQLGTDGSITVKGPTIAGFDALCCPGHWGEVRYARTDSGFVLEELTEFMAPTDGLTTDTLSLQVDRRPLSDGQYTARVFGAGISSEGHHVVVDPVDITLDEHPLPRAPDGYYCPSPENTELYVPAPDLGVCPGPTTLVRLSVPADATLELIDFSDPTWSTIPQPIDVLARLEDATLGGMPILVEMSVVEGRVVAIKEVAFAS